MQLKKELANRSVWLVGWHLMVLSIKTDHTNLQWHIDNSQSINNTLHCILGRPGGGIILDPLKSRTTPLGRVRLSWVKYDTQGQVRPLGSSMTLLGQVAFNFCNVTIAVAHGWYKSFFRDHQQYSLKYPGLSTSVGKPRT